MDTRRVDERDGLLDTNICIDELNGRSQARDAVASLRNPAISIITWIEVMAGTDQSDRQITQRYLDTFLLIQLTPAIAERAAAIRPETRLKLPDAIILATTQLERRILVTRNTRDFAPQTPGVFIPYTL